MREYEQDEENIQRYAPVLRRAIILTAFIIAVPVMMWTTTIFIRSYVARPMPTFRHLTLTEPLLTATPAPLLTDAAKTAGDGLVSLPDPNSRPLKGPLALPPGDASPPTASPTGPAEAAPNAPAAASGESSAGNDSTQSAATAKTSSEAVVTAEPIRSSLASLPDPNRRPLKGPLALPPGDASPPAASPTGPPETAPNALAPASGESSAVNDSTQSAATAKTSSEVVVTPEPIRGSLASLPDPNSRPLKGPIALPPGDASPPAASPTGPAEIAPNALAPASGESSAVNDSTQSAATTETASAEAVTRVQRDRRTATGPATGSIALVSPVPLPRVRPVDAPADTPSVPSSPLSGSPLLAHPAAYGYQPGIE
jgi:hypothetical protein